FLGIEKCMGKAKEGIGSKGFMKRIQKGKKLLVKLASSRLAIIAANQSCTSNFAAGTSCPHSFLACAHNFLACVRSFAHSKCCLRSFQRCPRNLSPKNTQIEGQNWNFKFWVQGQASMKPKFTLYKGRTAETQERLSTIHYPLGLIHSLDSFGGICESFPSLSFSLF
ncbi:hypothetical protein PIB30_099502, partial [Stylosanthes scabra]|nr:hypothetical protein [Stylosanthes scabra]